MTPFKSFLHRSALALLVLATIATSTDSSQTFEVEQGERRLRGPRKCGRGKNKTPCTPRPTVAPTPRPTPAPVAPTTPRPTPAPTPGPTPAPATPRPTPAPVAPTTPSPGGGNYNIQLELVGVSRTGLYSNSQHKWQSTVTGDLPDITGLAGYTSACGPYPSLIDDLFICAKVRSMKLSTTMNSHCSIFFCSYGCCRFCRGN